MLISIIIPTHNDSGNNIFFQTLENLKSLKNIEVIVVDLDINSDFLDKIKNYSITYYSVPLQSRGKRLSYGSKRANGDIILYHHPRSLIDIRAIDFLKEHHQSFHWGALTHTFIEKRWFYKFTSWYSNYIRGDIRQIYYLDHCIFVKKHILDEVNHMPPHEIFEDTALCNLLKKVYKPIRIEFVSQTSAIRFEKNGIFFQSCMNFILKLCFAIGISPKKMNEIYEKGLNLNSKK